MVAANDKESSEVPIVNAAVVCAMLAALMETKEAPLVTIMEASQRNAPLLECMAALHLIIDAECATWDKNVFPSMIILKVPSIGTPGRILYDKVLQLKIAFDKHRAGHG